jgi:hypothetical protein
MSLKKYVTKRTNKLLPHSELCKQALSYIMLGEVYIVQVLCCEAVYVFFYLIEQHSKFV